MKTVYLDNAATTKLDATVADAIAKAMVENYGNPSSTHQFGRKAKTAIESARKNIAKLLNVTASELIFTSSGTEADNLILQNAVFHLGVKRIITSKIEHHAVLHTCQFLEKEHHIVLEYVDLDDDGQVNLNDLETLLSNSDEKTLVSLMHINNEIGNILPLKEVCDLCKQYGGLFHSDTVQTLGHFAIDLQETPVDFITCTAHKFHGPKGVGFAYFKKGLGVKPLFYGGEQEKGARSSTENVQGILGLEKALSLAYAHLEEEKKQIKAVKSYFIEELKKHFTGIHFNGLSGNLEKSTFTILNVRFPLQNKMLLFQLDMVGIMASSGSACQSGSNKGSHVLAEILSNEEANKTSIRFSFSKFTTKEEIDYTVLNLKELLK